MSKEYATTKRDDSDSDGSEDVFLDLAQSDEETDHAATSRPSNTSREGRHDPTADQVEHAIRNLPGQFPDRSATPRDDSRPRSSGVQSRTFIDRTGPLWAARHARHVSQPLNSTSYSNNLTTSRQGASQRLGYGRYADHSATPDSDSSDAPRLRRQKNLYVDAEEYSDAQPPLLVNGIHHRTPRHFSVHLASTAQASPSSITNQAFPHDSDSADSQTAASTVWDELDDLKSRIRKLETTGKLPSTSNAAMAGHATGRPQTATTAPTTVSSSPKHVRKQSMLPSAVLSSPAMVHDVHPTLQSALGRAKSNLKPHIYRPLEATVIDSLALATMTGRQNSSAAISTAASTVNGLSTSDRQLKRKIDNLCRNLADLCIAVCDARSDEMQVVNSPVNTQKAAPISPSYYNTQASEPREDLVSHSGTQSRRASLSWGRFDNYRAARGMSISGRQDHLPADLQHAAERSPSTTPKDYTARYSTIGRNESQSNESRYSTAETNVEEDVPAPRAISRAMTELEGRPGLSSKYDHLRLLPASQRSPSLRQTLEARRRSANIGAENVTGGGGVDVDTQSMSGTGTAHTPATRRFLDRIRGPASEVGSIASSGGRNRLSSQEPYVASPRLSTPVARATSLSNRRFATE
ncbi:hypothetical protein K461DRAFT_281243 [Myriangium duriaei CBS 260.36]|uniref:Uncharacterized protein n=1 Tax=Myriangium duriaei CBS 260.36 TaxID=1168546 RepID=A0A9P4MEA3_9PEZI|nr:hypothetical protein K461DRAFT_281243 [Myriangium duriaei CBS 260.36]